MATRKQTVDDYLAALPAEQREALESLRQVIRSAAPQAEEAISYRIPIYKHRGHLVGFGGFKDHCSLFAMSSSVLEQLARDLEPFDVRHTTVHFTPENPLPADVVREIVRLRIAENEGK